MLWRDLFLFVPSPLPPSPPRRGVVTAADLIQIDRRRREGHVPGFHGLGDNAGDRQVAEPLAVGRDDEPGGLLGAGPTQGLLIGLPVL